MAEPVCEFLKFLANLPMSGQSTEIEQCCRLFQPEAVFLCYLTPSGSAGFRFDLYQSCNYGKWPVGLNLLIKFFHLCPNCTKTVGVQLVLLFIVFKPRPLKL